MKSNFDFLTVDMDTQTLYQTIADAEKLYAEAHYDAALVMIRKVADSVSRMVVDFNFIEMSERANFNDTLREIKQRDLAPKLILDNFYELKKYGNDAAHKIAITQTPKTETLAALEKAFQILVWFNKNFVDGDFSPSDFLEPQAEQLYQTAERKLIYVQTGDNSDGLWPAYEGNEKIGDASVEGFEVDFRPNSDDLRQQAEHRIKQYMNTSGAKHLLQWAEVAYSDAQKRWFRDYDVHEVLRRSGVHPASLEGQEWFHTDLDTAKKAIQAVKEGRSSIEAKTAEPIEIKLRPEQQAAVDQTRNVFNKLKKNRMLWNAKMRFGKTITALELIKEEHFQRVLIMTHRPVVSDSWFEDFGKMGMSDKGYQYGSKRKGAQLQELVESDQPFIYFTSIQDLRGSQVVGGHAGDKNEELFQTDWDLVIIDEAHEGTQTELAQNVISAVSRKDTKILTLSGTPFNLLDHYDEDQVFTWDYVMEQKAKTTWSVKHPDEPNPYESLPKVSMYTFEMKHQTDYVDETKSFNFKEFFRVDDEGNFVHEHDVNGFLNEITRPDDKTNYPFSTKEFRSELRHTLWILPGVREAAALKALMAKHPVFGMEYEIVNAVDNGDSADGLASQSDLERVREAITDKPSTTKTVTLTVRKLTTGVNVKEWTGVMFLSNTTSAMQYMQAAFRAQTPFSDPELGMKTNAYIFDFAPDRALTIMTETTQLSTKAGKIGTTEQKQEMNQLLNFMPIIGTSGNGMTAFNVDNLLAKVKRVYAEKAVRTGFDDDSLYSDRLLLLKENDIEAFKDLQKIVGSTKSEKIDNKVQVNNQGFDQSEYDLANQGEKKPKRQRSEEEQEAIDKRKALSEQRKTLISVLRGISIRIPMMIYGMPVDIGEDVGVQKFIDNVDDVSWKEFMPKGVTKGMFKEFSQYYDADVFLEAGRIIRHKVKVLDALDPIERARELSEIFATFKNPDKETVLTPWRVVNMHLGKTIGGLSYYDNTFTDTTIDGVPADHWMEISETEDVFKSNTRILEINSKTGLYPLYAATSLYKLAFDQLNNQNAGKFTVADEEALWQGILNQNIYVVAKTPMAKTITERTLSGYHNYKTNVKYIDDIVQIAKKDVDEGVETIEKEFDDMKFDVVIGNPPYQEEAAGENTVGLPIYQHFYDMAFKLADKVTLITPARFLFDAGMTSRVWNHKMLNDKHFKVVFYNQDSSSVFPNTDIKGGIVITYHDNQREFKPIGTFTSFPELKSIMEKAAPTTEEDSLTKIIYTQNKFNLSKLYEIHPELKKIIGSNGMDKRFRNNTFDKVSVFMDTRNQDSDIDVIGLQNNKRVHKFIESQFVDFEHENLDSFKVLVPRSNGSGAIGEVLSTPLIGTPLIGTPLMGYTQTFIGIGNFQTLSEAEAALKYVKTKFARTMLGILKITQDNNRDKWAKVPLQNFNSDSDIDWSGSVANIDKQLYKKYKLTDSEIAFIESKVKTMS